MDIGTIVSLAIGGLTLIAFLGLLWFAYEAGKNEEKGKQDAANNEVLKELESIDSKPKPTSSDDRNSMRDGEF